MTPRPRKLQSPPPMLPPHRSRRAFLAVGFTPLPTVTLGMSGGVWCGMQSQLSLDDVTIAERRSEYVDRLIQRHHYLDTVPTPSCIYRYVISGGIRHGIIGAAMWGKPVARMEDQTDTLELLRFWTEDYTPKNTESYALSRMIRDIEQKKTHSRLIAYASTGQDHDGGIYRATNWEDAGVRETTACDGWENRDGRTTADPSAKRKFVYHL